MSSCDCFRCTEPIYAYDEHGRYIANNLCTKPCENCGRATTEHVDLGSWGYLECWWCKNRAAGSEELA